MVNCGIAWYFVVKFGICMVLFDIVWYRVKLCGIVFLSQLCHEM